MSHVCVGENGWLFMVILLSHDTTYQSAKYHLSLLNEFLQHIITLYVFNQICKYDIEKSIEREMSGDLKTGMVTIGTISIA